MRFLADMGVADRVAEWLRTHGHDTSHLRDEGLQRLPDGQIFDKALAEQRIILTHTPHVIERLAVVLADSMNALERGAIVVVEESRHRVRWLPIGSVEKPL